MFHFSVAKAKEKTVATRYVNAEKARAVNIGLVCQCRFLTNYVLSHTWVDGVII